MPMRHIGKVASSNKVAPRHSGGRHMATNPGTTRGAKETSDDRDGRFGRGGTVARRPSSRLSTETKHSSKTSEFYAYVAATVGVLLAGLLTKAGDGHDD